MPVCVNTASSLGGKGYGAHVLARPCSTSPPSCTLPAGVPKDT